MGRYRQFPGPTIQMLITYKDRSDLVNFYCINWWVLMGPEMWNCPSRLALKGGLRGESMRRLRFWLDRQEIMARHPTLPGPTIQTLIAAKY